MRSLFSFFAAAVLAPAAFAQASAPDPAPINYPSVAVALKDLEARDGNGTIVTHPDGWTIINEPASAAQWSFTPDRPLRAPGCRAPHHQANTRGPDDG
jgi:hypothetical protein